MPAYADKCPAFGEIAGWGSPCSVEDEPQPWKKTLPDYGVPL